MLACSSGSSLKTDLEYISEERQLWDTAHYCKCAVITGKMLRCLRCVKICVRNII